MVERLVQYTEQQQLQSTTHTSYWPELGTIHPAFTLQHVIDKHRHASQLMYLKSACDKIHLRFVWNLLQRLTMLGHMLGAVHALYAGSLLSMRTVWPQPESVHWAEAGLRTQCLSGIFIADSLLHPQATAACESGSGNSQTLSGLMTSASWLAALDICRLSLVPWSAILPHCTWRSVWHRRK